MRFTVSGTVRMGREDQRFTYDVEANSENHARQKVYSKFGSEHRSPRSHIQIETVESA